MSRTVQSDRSVDSAEETRVLKAVLFGLLAAFCLLVLFVPLNNDIWFLLAHGRHVLSSGLPTDDPLSMHDGLDFVMQQWLSSVIFWLVYTRFGLWGIKLLVLLFFIITTALFYRLSLIHSRDRVLPAFAVSCVAALVLIIFMTSRPYLFSTPLLILELTVLEKYAIRGSRGGLIALPLVSVLLINLHAAMWPMLFVFLAPYILEGAVERRHRYQIQILLLSGAVMALFGFFNPYGLSAMTYLQRSFGHQEINEIVGEMSPLDATTTIGQLSLLLMAVVMMAYFFAPRTRVKIRHVLLAAGTGVLTLIALRGLLFFAICGLFPLPQLLGPPRHARRSAPSNERGKLVLLIALLAFVVLSVASQLPTWAKEWQTREWFLSEQNVALRAAISALGQDQGPEDVVLYTNYGDGPMTEFLGYRPYIDTRAEVFLKSNNNTADIMAEYWKLQTGQLHYRTFLENYDFTHLIVWNEDILATYLPRDEGYRLIFEGAGYEVFVAKQSDA